MMFIICFFIILTLLLFIPIPIKLKMYYSLDDYYINIYNFTVFSKKKYIIFKEKHLDSTKNPPKDNFKSKRNHLKNKKISIKNINYKNLLSKLYFRKFKPFLKFNLNLEYSLSDSSSTAIFFGILNSLNHPLFILLSLIFSIKSFDLNFVPKFKDTYFIKAKSKSIVFISFANIIYIGLITLKYLLLSKEVTPKD